MDLRPSFQADDNKPVKAAICSERAAKMYGLEIFKREVNDEGNNTTRFVIMSKKKQYRKDAGKVSISFSVPHESGSLYNILTHFMFNNDHFQEESGNTDFMWM